MTNPIKKCTLAAFLVVAIVAGYFGSIVIVTFADVPDARLAQVVGLISAVQNAFLLIVGYYFGSSAGSQRKTDMINDLNGTGDGGKVITTTTANINKVTTVEPPTAPPTPPSNP